MFGCSVREMLSRVGADELAEWQAEYRISPWGEEREDWRAAMVCWMLYTANAGKDAPARKVEDFLPRFDPEDGAEADRPTAEELKAKLMGATAAAGGTITVKPPSE